LALTGVFSSVLLAALPVSAQSELSAAIMNGNEQLVSSLLRQEIDINQPDRDGSLPLQWTVYYENAGLVKQMLDAGADPNATNREGISSLILAVQNGNAAIAGLLVDAGAGVNNTMANGETPLMMAARTGELATMQLLLDKGAEIEATENLRGTTALMWAAANRNAPAVQLLLANGAQIAARSGTTRPGRNPYLAPTARDRIKEAFDDRGFGKLSTDVVDVNDGSPRTREEVLARIPENLLVDFEREKQNPVQPPPRKQWGGLTALHFAVRENDMDSVRVLVEAGADVNEVSEFGWSPLLTAIQNRFYRIGMYLLEHGADPDIANEGGWNPLYIATDNRNIEGGDYPTRKPDMDHLEFIRALLAAGADPNLRMNSSTETRTIFTHQWLREEGATPFLRAAQSSDLELMKLLLDNGADPNIKTRHGVTPLMVAAGIGWVQGVTYEWSEAANIETVKLLLELGNRVNDQDSEDGRTAMMGAAHKGRTEVARLLVEAGGDLSIHDYGSRDSLHRLLGATWQAIDYADGLVRVGVQSAEVHPETGAYIREVMLSKGMEVPPEDRTLDSICVFSICK
jgi:ankyrin repeat protein